MCNYNFVRVFSHSVSHFPRHPVIFFMRRQLRKCLVLATWLTRLWFIVLAEQSACYIYFPFSSFLSDFLNFHCLFQMIFLFFSEIFLSYQGEVVGCEMDLLKKIPAYHIRSSSLYNMPTSWKRRNDCTLLRIAFFILQCYWPHCCFFPPWMSVEKKLQPFLSSYLLNFVRLYLFTA